MREIQAPNEWKRKEDEPVIFLAGSIEMGSAVQWQKAVVSMLSKKEVLLLNPRRNDWDPSWVQSITNPQFKQQVVWELRGLENCDTVFMYFDPDTKSPITLLEFGLHFNKTVVCCPPGFWRRGNIEVVCDRYKVPL